jgi:putative copper export protein
MSFSTTYDVILSVKHILTFVMVIVAIYRRFVLGRKLRDFDAQDQRLYGILLMVNAFLGVIVVFLSGISAALG